MSPNPEAFILTLSCPDAVGIVASVTQTLAAQGALITEAHHYREPISNRSILRVVFEAGSPTKALDPEGCDA
jgi:formyltetrahydrofolate deformylase